jgi:hypothetical protein
MKEAIESDPQYLAQKQAEVAAMLAGDVPVTAEGQPEQFRTIDPLQENAHAMLAASKYVVSHDDMPAPREHTPEAPFAPKTRKTRADAGIPRAAKPKPAAPEPVPGAGPVVSVGLTEDQLQTILNLDSARTRARLEADDKEIMARNARKASNDAEAYYFNYLDSLTIPAAPATATAPATA